MNKISSQKILELGFGKWGFRSAEISKKKRDVKIKNKNSVWLSLDGHQDGSTTLSDILSQP